MLTSKGITISTVILQKKGGMTKMKIKMIKIQGKNKDFQKMDFYPGQLTGKPDWKKQTLTCA